MIDLRSLGVITTLAFLPLPALAHHGVSGQFDTSQTFEVTGTITRIRLVNPHAYVYFDVTDDSGEVTNMRCELSSGSLLKRRGWTADMFEIGSQITIQGSPDRTDPTTCFTRQITFANGVVAGRQSSFDENGNVEPEDRQREREDGTLNLAGNWAMIREEGAAPGPAGGPMQVALTEEGAEAVEDASPDDNPRFYCEPTNIIMDWWFDQMVNKIEQTDTEITMTYGFMDLVRTIHLDGAEMPADYQPNRAGFSVGTWEGDTLVVTTTGFDEGWINAPLGGGPDGPGARGVRPGRASDRPEPPEGAPKPPEGGPRGPQAVKNSTELTVVERFSLNEDGTVLTRSYTLTDPVYLEEPIEGFDEVTLTNDSYEPYACDDLTNERKQ